MIGKLTRILLVSFSVFGLIIFGILATAAHAQQVPQASAAAHGNFGSGGSHSQFPPGIFGKVTDIDGTSLTVSGGYMDASTTYSVNAGNAIVMKNGSTTSLSSIAIGDTVMIQGTVTGDSIVATKIMDGFAGMVRGGRGMPFGSSTRPSGSPSFASGTFPGGGFRNFSSSTVSSSTPNAHPGFFGSIMNFFGGIFGHFKF